MPVTKFELADPFEYLDGLNTYHQSEARPGVIPIGQSLPQRLKHDLYHERISGTSFTIQRKDNKQTWLMRSLPAGCHGPYVPITPNPLDAEGCGDVSFDANPGVWAPTPIAKSEDFVSGLRRIGAAGDPVMKQGVSYYSYTAGKSMDPNQAFLNVDGDFCIVPQRGSLDIKTELGSIRVRPHELCVIPRGFHFHVALSDGPVRGFILEVYSGHFDVPELGPIGSYGLANIRDFQIPRAAYESTQDADTEIIKKFAGSLHRATYRGSIFNVVAWHGTYYPFKYDLGRFNAIGSISHDHPDPSIFTVLTCPSERSGEPAADIAAFGPRWLVMENSFRPPYYHRNTMSEFSMLIAGGFDAAAAPPQLHGLYSLNNCMNVHGPSREAFDEATAPGEQRPTRVPDEHLGVLFESCYMIGTTRWAQASAQRMPVTAESRGPELDKARL